MFQFILEGESKINGQLEVHRLYDGFFIRDLTNAGKRGKTVSCVSVSGDRNAMLLLLRKVMESNSFEEAKQMILTATTGSGVLTSKTYTENSYDVDPADKRTIYIRGSRVNIRANLRSFSIRDLTDGHNQPTLMQNDKRGPRAFYKICQEHGEKLAEMDFNEVNNFMSLAGIKTHYYCMD